MIIHLIQSQVSLPSSFRLSSMDSLHDSGVAVVADVMIAGVTACIILNLRTVVHSSRAIAKEAFGIIPFLYAGQHSGIDVHSGTDGHYCATPEPVICRSD